MPAFYRFGHVVEQQADEQADHCREQEPQSDQEAEHAAKRQEIVQPVPAHRRHILKADGDQGAEHDENDERKPDPEKQGPPEGRVRQLLEGEAERAEYGRDSRCDR